LSVKISALLLTLLSFASLTFAAPQAPQQSTDAINAKTLRKNLEFIASPEMRGRYTLSPELGIAARYLATRLESYGLKGAAPDGSFFQKFPLLSTKIDPQSSIVVENDGNKAEFNYGDFFTSNSVAGTVSGPVVFAGYGISAPRLHHDDYAALDAKGKIVVTVGGAPSGIDESTLNDSEQAEGAAAAHGALAIITIPTGYYAEIMKSERFRKMRLARESVRLDEPSPDTSIPGIYAAPALADKLLAPLGLTFDTVSTTSGTPFAPKEMSETLSLNIIAHQEHATAQNVAGIIEGTDPQLKSEYVTFSAHYDHLKQGSDGRIYPGADDDGSGTVSVLNIAKAMSLHPPKRSVLIIFHAGEELGLLGSQYNADFGHIVPDDKMVVDLNIDMIGRSKKPGDTEKKDEHLTGPDTIYLVGADRISSELNKISEDADHQTEDLKLDYYYNDPKNPERIYYRSDHWNYAKHNIPIIFYFDGTSIDYHQPTDTVDKIDFDKLTRVARLVFETGWRLAELDHELKKDVAQPSAAPSAK